MLKAIVADITESGAAHIASAVRESGTYEAEILCDGAAVLNAVYAKELDAVVINDILPVTDADEIISRIAEDRPAVMPSFIIIHTRGMPLPRQVAGVPMSILNKPVDRDELLRALDEARLENRKPDIRTEEIIASMLDSLSVAPHRGRDCIADAVFLVLQDTRLAGALTKRLYPLVEARLGLKRGCAERAMRHSIDAAWKSGSIENQYSIFKGSIDARRGKPTCGEMLARLAGLLRREV